MSEATPGPGADLKAAREGLQVSIREVADALNLPTRVIEALETDDYDRLPPTVFTRGYLRSYARLLELPPDALLARYPEVTEEVEITSDTRTGTHAVVTQSRHLLLPLGVGAILVVLVLVWLLRDEDASQPSSARPLPTVPAVAGEQDATAEPVEPEPALESMDSTAGTGRGEPSNPTPVLSAPEPLIDTSDTDVRGDVASPDAGSVESAAEPEPAVSEARDVDASPPPVPTFRERRITEFGDDRMRFSFAEDCWLEVKSLDGENLYSDLNRAGTTLELIGRAPFRILLGYAPGVKRLEFNGEMVDLPRYSRNNVASVVLGQ